MTSEIDTAHPPLPKTPLPRPPLPRPGLSRPGLPSATPVLFSSALAETSPLRGIDGPLLLRPRFDGLSVASWLAQEGPDQLQEACRAGAVLLRGFAECGPSTLTGLLDAAGAPASPYVNRSTPRTQVGADVYTATEYPADRDIPLHSEMSYASQWPRFIAFLCQVPSASGGETLVADCRRVYRSLPEELRTAFARHGVCYLRQMGQGVDLTWQTVFQTSDKACVEAFCRDNAIEYAWLPGDVLRTRDCRPAIRQHPRTGETVWFNQAHLFHRTAPGPETQALLARALGDGNEPRHACLGDGTEIPVSWLDQVRAAFAEHTIAIPWRAGDIVLLDNLLFAHGRNRFAGERRLLVALGGMAKQ